MLKNLDSVVTATALAALFSQALSAEPPVLRSLLVVPHDDSLTTYGANRVDLVLEYDTTDANLAGGSAAITVKEKKGKKTSWSGLPPANSEPIRVNFVPGTRFTYSGGGITVLQQLMIDAVDMSFEEILEALVFRPLDMHGSTFEQPLPRPLQKNAAIAHSIDYPDLGGAIAFTYPELAAAGLWTTPADLARHMIGLIEAHRGKRKELISRRLARRMLKNHMDGMGMGWFIEGNRKDLTFQHGGANIGFRAMAIARPSTGTGIVVMTNGTQLINEVAASIIAQHGWLGP